MVEVDYMSKRKFYRNSKFTLAQKKRPPYKPEKAFNNSKQTSKYIYFKLCGI